MTFSISPEEMGRLDRLATREYGIPSLILMENAGCAVFHEIERLFRHGSYREVRVFCGKGNNGGDGSVVARHAHNARIPTSVYFLGDRGAVSRDTDAGLNLTIIERMGLAIEDVADASGIAGALSGADPHCLIVDAVFGTGLSGEVRGPAREWIEAANALPSTRIAVDIPSGLDGEHGRILGAAFRADITITLGLPKIGLRVNQGPGTAGAVVVADISIPREEIEAACRASPDHS